MKELNHIVEELIYYAKHHLFLNDIDAVYVRNLIFNRLNINNPYDGEINKKRLDELTLPDSLIDELKESLSEKGFKNIELLIVEIMGLLTPIPSEVINKINALENKKVGLGLDYLFDLQIKNNYIQKTAIDKNIYFKKEYDDNFLEITINLSKPEKNNKEVAKLLKKVTEEKYPKCLLCLENLGYAGREDHPARGNIRILPLKLNNEDWFLQYSPYAYFDHHAIVIHNDHHNMTINDTTFIKLLEFVNKIPTFFIGSNADLPIVGGSILNHEHYQAGTHLLPMFFSKDRELVFENEDLKVSILNWYNSVIKIEGKDYNKINEVAKTILKSWRVYSNESLDIISSKDEIHNTITPIARKDKESFYLYLILRNNRCNEMHPEGIFHAHKKYHHIKQEGIGLIEAMGLFILPARLKRQMGYVEEILISTNPLEEYYDRFEDLYIHKEMIDELVLKYGRGISDINAKNIINDYISNTCLNILKNTAVFKDDEISLKAFKEFILSSIK